MFMRKNFLGLVCVLGVSGTLLTAEQWAGATPWLAAQGGEFLPSGLPTTCISPPANEDFFAEGTGVDAAGTVVCQSSTLATGSHGGAALNLALCEPGTTPVKHTPRVVSRNTTTLELGSINQPGTTQTTWTSPSVVLKYTPATSGSCTGAYVESYTFGVNVTGGPP